MLYSDCQRDRTAAIARHVSFSQITCYDVAAPLSLMSADAAGCGRWARGINRTTLITINILYNNQYDAGRHRLAGSRVLTNWCRRGVMWCDLCRGGCIGAWSSAKTILSSPKDVAAGTSREITENLRPFLPPNCHLTLPLQKTPTNIRKNIMLLKPGFLGYISVADSVAFSIYFHSSVITSEMHDLCAIKYMLTVQGHPRSLILHRPTLLFFLQY